MYPPFMNGIDGVYPEVPHEKLESHNFIPVAHPFYTQVVTSKSRLFQKQRRGRISDTQSTPFPMPDFEPPVLSLKGLLGPHFFRG